MSMLDLAPSRFAASDIVTRSDYVPTDYERYGLWAQKFYGGGYHQEFKDAAISGATDSGEIDTSRISTRH